MDKLSPVKPTVPYALLESLDVRVGTIRAVGDVPKSDKLVRLRVGFGDHERVVLAGLKKERPDPQVLVEVSPPGADCRRREF
jgi:tRNA-binding protein